MLIIMMRFVAWIFKSSLCFDPSACMQNPDTGHSASPRMFWRLYSWFPAVVDVNIIKHWTTLIIIVFNFRKDSITVTIYCRSFHKADIPRFALRVTHRTTQVDLFDLQFIHACVILNSSRVIGRGKGDRESIYTQKASRDTPLEKVQLHMRCRREESLFC